MSKQSKGGNGNMLLLAGLGIGAFMLFGNKSNAQSSSGQFDANGGGPDEEIPAAPKILAVNSSATESPLPTGIVSDEEGMEATTVTTTQNSVSSSTDNDEDGDETYSGGSKKPGIPPIVSTKLTPKEKAIIDKGQLSNDLAIQRPDLYKAIYIKKHGGKGNGQKALLAAEALISQIQAKGITKATPAQKSRRRVAIKLHPKAGKLVRQAKTTGTAHPAVRPTPLLPAGRTATGNKPLTRPGAKGSHPAHKAAHPLLGRKRPVVHRKKVAHPKP